MPAVARLFSRFSRLKCGNLRDMGNARMSTRVLIECACRAEINCSIGRVEWPMVWRVAMTSSDANCYGEGLIKFPYFGIRKRSDEMRQTRFVHARQVIAQDPTRMLETFFDAYRDLG